MKAVAILTEARSGSEWLASLTNGTGSMGRSGEWLGEDNLGFMPGSMDALVAAVEEKAATANGAMCVKLFPRHLQWSQKEFGGDFLHELRRRHDVGLILLERRDRVRQAISFCRAKATGKWKSSQAGTGQAAVYDFADLCASLVYIERSYAFWRAYLTAFDLGFEHVCYEDMLADPSPYVDAVARHLGLPAAFAPPATALKVQRDAETEEWAARFRADIARRGIMSSLSEKQVRRTFGNFLNFLAKRPLESRGP